MTNTTERDIGALQADMRTVQKDIHDIKSDVREMRDIMQNVRGGWKMFLLFGTIAATLGGIATKLLSYLPTLK